MKINNNMPVTGKPVRKTSRNATDAVFGQMLDSRIDQIDTVEQPQSDDSGSGSQQAWQSLGESISLLDQALQCIEHGERPSDTLIDQIERLRGELRQHTASGSNPELSQADTLLAVEAERMRAMQD